MCGIIGYVGDKNCIPVIIGGLKRLEYRGYDSAGLAVESKGKLELVRSVGKVDSLHDLIKKSPVSGKTGLGHTRWATHGKPSEENAHPHTDCNGELVVVHNGIIENYIQLKEKLSACGHKFRSETDTEVFAHLIEEKIKNLSSGGRDCRMHLMEPILFEAVRLAAKEAEGAFALGVLWSKCPGTLIGARRHSPLIVGLGEGENFLASDVPAFLDYTKKVVYLNDGDIAVLKPSGVSFFDASGKKTAPEAGVVQWDRTMAEKAGYKHFMLKEINEQPDAVEDTLRGRVTPLDDDMLHREFGLAADYAKKLEQIQIIGCGTAYHAGLVGKYVLEHFTGVPVHVDIASEFRYRGTPLSKHTLILSISQSGETADTLAAVKEMKKAGFHTLAICNVVGSSLTRESHCTFHTHCGPEIGVASTKAFVGQLTALYVLALHLALARGKMSQAQAKEYAHDLMKMSSHMRAALELDPQIKALAKKLARKGHYLFLGRNANYPIALEGALKIKEIAYVHAEAFAGGEMKHGPIAIIEEGMPILGIAVKAKTSDKMLSNLQEAKARGALVVGIVSEGSEDGRIKLDETVSVPETGEYFSPLLTVIPLQLFAYHVAAELGCDIDQPRNLAKSVTVE